MAVKIGLHNFFGVEKSEIELSPFMIFCGDNGSGKTHLVKMLNSIDQFMRTPFGISTRGIEEKIFIDTLRGVDFMQLITEETHRIAIHQDDEVYDAVEVAMNQNLNYCKKEILEKTFSETKNVLERISIKIQHRPEMEIEITYKGTRDEEDAEENERGHEFRFKFRTKGQKKPILTTVTRMTSTVFAENQRVQAILASRLDHMFIRAVYMTNFQLKSRETYYFPASREAYMRDYSYFLNREKGTNNKMIITEFDLDSEEESQIRAHSNDPYIETHVDQMIQTVNRPDTYNEDLVRYLEDAFLKVKFHRANEAHKYILEDETMISTDLGSSLQNEYSFLRILLGNKKSPNIIIEEPEAHLSIRNSVILAYILIAIQQKLGNKVWITTHSNFIVDAVNNAIMLAKLDKSTQQSYLKKIGIGEVLESVDEKMTNKIAAYYLNEGMIQQLPRGEQGIVYDDFTKQIHDFIDISTDLQWEVENLDGNHGD